MTAGRLPGVRTTLAGAVVVRLVVGTMTRARGAALAATGLAAVLRAAARANTEAAARTVVLLLVVATTAAIVMPVAPATPGAGPVVATRGRPCAVALAPAGTCLVTGDPPAATDLSMPSSALVALPFVFADVTAC
jgi:hypothetical protein